jgi:aspartyl protease family protein
MATGFMGRLSRHFIALSLLLACGSAAAAGIALIGVIGDKAAVLALDGGNPKAVKVGQTWSGIKVLSVDKTHATVEVEGQQRVLLIGQHYRNANTVVSSSSASVTLAADPRGHFFSEGSVNGQPMRFLVDTGATMIAIPASDARRLGIDYRRGVQGRTRTAGGVVTVYKVTLDSVRLGGIEVTGVDAVVIEEGLDIALLGMSFLARLDMRQEGRTMTLIKRF